MKQSKSKVEYVYPEEQSIALISQEKVVSTGEGQHTWTSFSAPERDLHLILRLDDCDTFYDQPTFTSDFFFFFAPLEMRSGVDAVKMLRHCVARN